MRSVPGSAAQPLLHEWGAANAPAARAFRKDKPARWLDERRQAAKSTWVAFCMMSRRVRLLRVVLVHTLTLTQGFCRYINPNPFNLVIIHSSLTQAHHHHLSPSRTHTTAFVCPHPATSDIQ